MSFSVKGFKAAAVSCGIKKSGRPDLSLIYSEVPAVASAAFTKNAVKAAPVLLSMKNSKNGCISAVLANSGNANAATGKEGYKNAEKTASAVAAGLPVRAGDVFVCSTGVIGVKLPVAKIIAGVKAAARRLRPEGLEEAARGIMTTDTFIKTAGAGLKLGGRKCGIFGMAKGSGMIHPDLATMLCFVLTDVSVSKQMLDAALGACVKESFNSITVDGDTSTNDTVLCLANGMAGNRPIKARGREYNAFLKALSSVMISLAKQIVRDGEGASKFVEIEVKGAVDEKTARAAAMAIAKSSLVKTAVYGGDPNWGRVLSAVGNSGIKFREEKIKIFFGGLKVVSGGIELPGFSEKKAHTALAGKEVRITVDLGAGKNRAKVWTCDFTEGYIKINAHYRT